MQVFRANMSESLRINPRACESIRDVVNYSETPRIAMPKFSYPEKCKGKYKDLIKPEMAPGSPFAIPKSPERLNLQNFVN
jgi:hypothetical protein